MKVRANDVWLLLPPSQIYIERREKERGGQDGLLEFSIKCKWVEPLINKPDSYLGRHQPVQVQPYKV
jgi:hypothetical protein